MASDDWISPERRTRVIRQIWDDHKGYPDSFYEARDTYKEDAAECYQRHGRPGYDKGPFACVDYRDASKRLTDRHWKGRNPSRDHVFLCEFCPYSSVVMTRKRSAAGQYDD